MLVLAALGLTLIGCVGDSEISGVIRPAVGEHELTITVSGDGTVGGTRTLITITGDKTITIDDNDDKWYYDLSANEDEYAAIETLFSAPYYVHIHLLASKKPK